MVRPISLAAVALLLLSGGTASADPPGRVGRLSYMEGTVSYHGADQDQWSPATLNYPLTTGDGLWTEPGAKAEVQVGPAEIRLDQSTDLEVVRLDDEASLIHIGRGVLNIHVHSLPPGGFDVETPRATVTLLKPGRYRIDAGQPEDDRPAETAEVAVLEGQARLGAPDGTLTIEAGEKSVISGDPATFSLAQADVTPFDTWALAREPGEAAAETARYVSPQVTGYQDLGAHGYWQSLPDYGPVWYPRAVAMDWAPYRYGHWMYRDPWGWTWIDDAPWGFAPFHYGRWVYVGHRWGWWPGRVVARPVYAPALVAFVGGAGWSLSLFSGGARPVGWVPLAPYEVFRPYYRSSVTYIRNVNITTVNKTVVNNITTVNKTLTVNRLVNRQAATAVSARAFTNAEPVHKAAVALPREQLATARVTANVGHLRPTPAAKAGVAPQALGADQPGPTTKGPGIKSSLAKSRIIESSAGRADGRDPQTAAVPTATDPVVGGNRRGDQGAPAARPRRAEPTAPRPSRGAAPEKSPAAVAPSPSPAPSGEAAPNRPRGSAPGPAIVEPNAAPQTRSVQPQASSPRRTPPAPQPSFRQTVHPSTPGADSASSARSAPAPRSSPQPSYQAARQRPQQPERPAVAVERPAQQTPSRPPEQVRRRPQAQVPQAAPQAAPQPEPQQRQAAPRSNRPAKGRQNDKLPDEG